MFACPHCTPHTGPTEWRFPTGRCTRQLHAWAFMAGLFPVCRGLICAVCSRCQRDDHHAKEASHA